MVVFCDNTGIINISKNHVLHSRIKHIDIRHHFILELVEDKAISLEYVPIEGHIADILTKSLDVSRFESLRRSIGLCTLTSSKTCLGHLLAYPRVLVVFLSS